MKNALFCTIVIVVLIGGSSFTDYGVPKVNAAPTDPYAGVTDSWDRNLRSSSRFTVLSGFASAAVRDNNTGLVWEQAPATLAGGWPAARLACINKTVSNTTGWRLPSVVELKSIQDTSLSAPFIPNVFNGIQASSYWSGSSDADTPTSAWAVEFANGTAFYATKVGPTYLTWCVRGPINADAY